MSACGQACSGECPTSDRCRYNLFLPDMAPWVGLCWEERAGVQACERQWEEAECALGSPLDQQPDVSFLGHSLRDGRVICRQSIIFLPRCSVRIMATVGQHTHVSEFVWEWPMGKATIHFVACLAWPEWLCHGPSPQPLGLCVEIGCWYVVFKNGKGKERSCFL